MTLMLEKEPTAKEVIGLLAKDKDTDVVFCGLGEPTLKIEELKEVARICKELRRPCQDKTQTATAARIIKGI
jgi:pyruvate-formate lyase-activating enzyme